MSERPAAPAIGGSHLQRSAHRVWPLPIRVVALAAVLLVVPLTLVNWTAELLWFRSLGYEDIFWRLRLAKLTMFAAAFGLVFTYTLSNLHILGRLADLSSVLGSSVQGVNLRTWPTQPGAKAAPPQAYQLTRPFVLASAIAAGIFGFVYYSEWDRLSDFWDYMNLKRTGSEFEDRLSRIHGLCSSIEELREWKEEQEEYWKIHSDD